jgi:GDP/UDP-N,N'-diacetylbacillosamine 2-epimerase (hydrolysing)
VKMRNICVVTGSRAEYGLLVPTLRRIQASASLNLQLVVTGMHLAPEYGSTYQQIEQDGFVPNKKIEMLLSGNSPSSIAKSMGVGLIGFADSFEELKPDLVVLLGDRFELLSAANAALVANIPIAHIHGGEVTEGAYDDAIRHAITKMSSLHFVSCEAHRSRVLQLGEKPKNVINSGAPGLEYLATIDKIAKEDLEVDLGIDLSSPSFLVTWHPVTREEQEGMTGLVNLLDALRLHCKGRVIFTASNADTSGNRSNKIIQQFVAEKPIQCIFVPSLGQVRYWSVLHCVDAVVGNSSSGIIEAPSIPVGSINIGDRQKGRTRASSVIDCGSDVKSILNAFDVLWSPEYRKTLRSTQNPYEKSAVSESIVKSLETCSLLDLKHKPFIDL